MKTEWRSASRGLVVPYQGRRSTWNWERLPDRGCVEVIIAAWTSRRDGRRGGHRPGHWRTTGSCRRCHKGRHPGGVLRRRSPSMVEKLITATFIDDYPVERAPIAKRKPRTRPAFHRDVRSILHSTATGVWPAFSEMNSTPSTRKRASSAHRAVRKALCRKKRAPGEVLRL
jgi:hypothetical protein